MTFPNNDRERVEYQGASMSHDLPNHHRPSSRTRPLSVTILALGVLTIAGFNLIRFYQAIRLWNLLSEFPTVSPLYFVVSGLVWGAICLVLAWGLWLGCAPAWRFTLIFTLVYTLVYWIDRLWISSPGLSANVLFIAGLNLILLLVIAWILTRPGVRLFFGVMHEQ
jgi:hypothetical protein